jgi:hypothetical protein
MGGKCLSMHYVLKLIQKLYKGKINPTMMDKILGLNGIKKL